ncbi:MAG: dihydropteroate synthase [Omnitrophica bacterium RIFCSPLOWO2_01_FULL_45_10]|nr:MAG: dihydropteroate synthase [Omnitrophica bacterium RIFCSPLOWO2_01_FULL_45_10]
MGILNVTPDSFSDGGKFFDKATAIEQGLRMARDGADIIDVGGESTRPGAKETSAHEELGRIIPVIEGLREKVSIPISVDTRKARVAEESIKAGASIVNDVSALRHDPDMADIVSKHDAAVILMHMRGRPQDMQLNPIYGNLILDITNYLRESIDLALKHGIPRERIVIDPGIGFGKTVEHNLEILKRLDAFGVLGCPICIGTSRKSFISKVLNLPQTDTRLFGTLATLVIGILKGANILRVHDVKEAVQAARMTDSVLKQT